MNEIIAKRGGSRCKECRDLILVGDHIVFIDDLPVHAECEATPPSPPTPSMQLLRVLTRRGMLSYHLLQSDFNPDQLPESVAEKFWDALAAEESLLSLLDDVASEHVVERT